MRTNLLAALLATAWLGIVWAEEPSTSEDATAEPTQAAEIPAAVCGNGLLEADETCEECPDDCTVAEPCEVGSKQATATLRLVAPEDSFPLGLALRIPYRGTQIQIPGIEFETSVGERVAVEKESTRSLARDVGHSLRLVLTDSQGLDDAATTVTFDRCRGAKTAEDDALCIVEGCTGRGVDIKGCSCEILLK